MLSPHRPSYAQVDRWRQYQSYFPSRMRICPGREPAEEWWNWRGAEIHLDRFAAPDAPLTVIVLHGAGGYGRLLAPWGLLLRDRGYEVVLPDLPGYGLSRAPADLFSYTRWIDCVADLVEAEARRSRRPVALAGASVGGYLGYLAAAQGRGVAGVIALTLADPRLEIVRDQFARHTGLNRGLWPLVSPLLPVVGELRLPIRWFANMKTIVNDPRLAELLCVDPLGGGNRVPVRFMHSLLTVRPAIEPEDFDLCPVLLTQPAADRWTTLEASQPFFDRIRGPKELVMLEGCGHLPIEDPGVSQWEQASAAFLLRLLQRA